MNSKKFCSKISTSKLASKNDIAHFLGLTDFDDKLKNLNKKITSNKTKNVLVRNEFKKL